MTIEKHCIYYAPYTQETVGQTGSYTNRYVSKQDFLNLNALLVNHKPLRYYEDCSMRQCNPASTVPVLQLQHPFYCNKL